MLVNVTFSANFRIKFKLTEFTWNVGGVEMNPTDLSAAGEQLIVSIRNLEPHFGIPHLLFIRFS